MEQGTCFFDLNSKQQKGDKHYIKHLHAALAAFVNQECVDNNEVLISGIDLSVKIFENFRTELLAQNIEASLPKAPLKKLKEAIRKEVPRWQIIGYGALKNIIQKNIPLFYEPEKTEKAIKNTIDILLSSDLLIPVSGGYMLKEDDAIILIIQALQAFGMLRRVKRNNLFILSKSKPY